MCQITRLPRTSGDHPFSFDMQDILQISRTPTRQTTLKNLPGQIEAVQEFERGAFWRVALVPCDEIGECCLVLLEDKIEASRAHRDHMSHKLTDAPQLWGRSPCKLIDRKRSHGFEHLVVVMIPPFVDAHEFESGLDHERCSFPAHTCLHSLCRSFLATFPHSVARGRGHAVRS